MVTGADQDRLGLLLAAAYAVLAIAALIVAVRVAGHAGGLASAAIFHHTK